MENSTGDPTKSKAYEDVERDLNLKIIAVTNRKTIQVVGRK